MAVAPPITTVISHFLGAAPTLEERALELLARNRSGELTHDERAWVIS